MSQNIFPALHFEVKSETKCHPNGPSETLWTHPGEPLGALGALLGALGGSWGALWSSRGGLWELRGGLWDLLGVILGSFVACLMDSGIVASGERRDPFSNVATVTHIIMRGKIYTERVAHF